MEGLFSRVFGGLDTLGLKTYSQTMPRKVIAGLFLALWVVLFAIEFSEDMGFIDYDEPEMDHCVETTLASLGEAIKISDDLRVAPSCFVLANSVPYFAFLGSQEVSFRYIGKRAEFFKAEIPIYSLHQVFLI